MAKCAVIFLVVFASCLSWARADTELVPPCNSSRSTSLSFSIVSRKNETGHWVAEVKMGPELTDGRHNGGWQIHVDQNTVDNSGKEPIVQIRATITAPAMIAPGYEYFPSIGYYKLHTEGKTWDEAKAACEKEKTHLAIINSEAESEVIKQLFARYPNLGGPGVAAFVGFHDKETEGQYVTIYGESLASTGFTRWSTIGNQPDDAGSAEDCGSVHRNGGLNDFPCSNKAPFFCEQDLFPPSNGHTYDKGHKAVSTGRNPLIDVRQNVDEVKPEVNEVDIDKPKEKEPDTLIIDEIAAE